MTVHKTPSYDYLALSVKKSGLPANRNQVVKMGNGRKRHLQKLETTGAGIFAPTHKPPSLLHLRLGKGVVCKIQPNPLILNFPFTFAPISHFRGGRMKKAKNPVFQSCKGSRFCMLHIFFRIELCAFLSECDFVCQHKPLLVGNFK